MASEVASEASDSDDDEGSVEFSGGKHSHAREETPLLGAVPSTSTNTARRQKFRSFDEALEGVSVGVFHLVLVLVCGWAIASDSVEIQCISFVTPQLDQSNNISNGNEVYSTHAIDTKRERLVFMHTHTHTHTHTHSHTHTHTHTHRGMP